MSDPKTPAKLAANYLKYTNECVGADQIRFAYALNSIAASLVAQTELLERLATPAVLVRPADGEIEVPAPEDAVEYIARVERSAYNRGYENARDRFQFWNNLHEADEMIEQLRTKLQGLEAIAAQLDPDQPDHFVRWLLHRLRDDEFPEIDETEPEPGRDWFRVEAHLFKPSGKWMYRVYLDYSGLRHRGIPGEGPAGWHFDGPKMARIALHTATTRGTSEVSMREIPTGWRLFVQNPPQGYPVYAIGGLPDEHPDADATELAAIREFVRMWQSAAEGNSTGDLRMGDIAKVLDR